MQIDHTSDPPGAIPSKPSKVAVFGCSMLWSSCPGDSRGAIGELSMLRDLIPPCTLQFPRGSRNHWALKAIRPEDAPVNLSKSWNDGKAVYMVTRCLLSLFLVLIVTFQAFFFFYFYLAFGRLSREVPFRFSLDI